MLNTSAGAGRLEATPQVGDYGYGSAQRCPRSRPGVSAGRRLRCVAATPAAAAAPRRAAWLTGELGAANIRLRGRGCIRCNESGWLPGRARGATDDAEV